MIPRTLLLVSQLIGCRSSDPSDQTDPTSNQTDATDTDATDTGPELGSNDAYDDVIMATAEGAQWMVAQGDGTWALGTFRADLGLGDADLAAADLDGDGWTDLVVTSDVGSEVWMSDGGGGFAQALFDPALGRGVVGFTPADVDGDGAMELWVRHAGGLERWSWVDGDLFREPVELDGLDDPAHVVLTVGDFDGDGRDDLLASSATATAHWFMLDGTPTAMTTTPDTLLADHVPFDMDGDGADELLVVDGEGTHWLSFGTTGWSDFAPVRADLPAGEVAYTVADVDGDGDEDLLISTLRAVSLYRSSGDGTFDASRIDTHVLGDIAYTPLDFDGNGTTDVLATTDEHTRLLAADATGALLEVGALSASLGNATFTVGRFGRAR